MRSAVHVHYTMCRISAKEIVKGDSYNCPVAGTTWEDIIKKSGYCGYLATIQKARQQRIVVEHGELDI
jgi:hypothetical protein